MSPELFSKKIEHLKWVTDHNISLLDDTKKSEIQKLAAKFGADKEALTRKYNDKIKEQHDFYTSEYDYLHGKYLNGDLQ